VPFGELQDVGQRVSAKRMKRITQYIHAPVMLDEVIAAFDGVPAGTIVDATLGGGGHAGALLDRREDLRVLGIDRDDAAHDAVAPLIVRFGTRLAVERGRFDHIPEFLSRHELTEISGALFDLGVSSPQLDCAERGFSYREAGPLDMRMDRSQERTADDVVNRYDEGQIEALLRAHADERHARRIARAIVSARPIRDTAHLADVVVAAIPAPARRTGGHPAKRTFQAVRIEVNGELDALPVALRQAIDATVLGGRIAVLSYHSGEDRLVADAFADADRASPPDASPFVHPASVRSRVRRVRAPRRPSPVELERNPRASAAKLRVVEKVGR